MAGIESTNARSAFFPRSKTTETGKLNKQQRMRRNDSLRKSELDTLSKKDVKVDIGSAIKDFSRIKKAVDAAPDIDKSAKIADLKARIQNGTYDIDYDGLADSMLKSEF